MPLTNLAVQKSTANGATLTFVPAVTGGHAAVNRANNVVFLVSTSGTACTVTIRSVIANRPGDSTYPPNTVADRSYLIGATADAIIGPFPNAFNNADGSLELNYSAITGVTVAAVEVPAA